MSRTVAIHQPNFLPWIGFIYKWMSCDIFVLLDDVQFIRRGYTNRVKIKTPSGPQWITLPVIKKGRYYQNIDQVEIDHALPWTRKILGTLQAGYGKTPYFDQIFPGLSAILEKEQQYLVDLNIELLEWLAQYLDIQTKTTRSSQLAGVSGESTGRLVSICQKLKADKYLSGFGGQKYQEEEIFKAHNVELAVYPFTHPVYTQLWGEFSPGLSVIDLLFNCGPDSKHIIHSK